MKVQDGQKILFIGDSITDCGRREEQSGGALGSGYVRRFSELLTLRHPERNIEVVNTGIGGNTVEDLMSRWEDDVLEHKPDFLSIKIGINDVNRHQTDPDGNNLQSPEEFARIYRQILELTKERLPNTQLMIITPFFASTDTTEGSYRARVKVALEQYIATAKEMSEEFGTLLFETQPSFEKVFEHKHRSVYFPKEPVHPNSAGHLLLAEGVYSTLS